MAKQGGFYQLEEEWLKEVTGGGKSSKKSCKALKSFLEKQHNAEQYVGNLLQFLTKNLPKHAEAVQAFNELAIWSLKRVEKMDNVLVSIFNYFVVLYNSKDLWQYTMDLIPSLSIQDTAALSEKDAKMYLDLTTYLTSSYIRLHRNEYFNKDYLEGLLRNFSTLLKSAAASKNAQFFVEQLKKVFDRKYLYGQRLIEMDATLGSAFICNLLDVLDALSLQIIEDSNVVSELFLIYTDLLEIFMAFELKNNLHDLKLSRRFTKICTTSQFFGEIETHCNKVLQVLCEIFVKRKAQEVAKLCNEFEQRIEKLSVNIGEPSVVDTFATIALILSKLVEKLKNEFTVTACVSMMRSVKTQIKISKENRKSFCNFCSNSDSKKHCITTLISVALNFFKIATKESQEVPEMAFMAMLRLIEHNFYIMGRFKCSQKEIVMINFLRSTFNALIRVKQKNVQQYVLKIMLLLLENMEKYCLDASTHHLILKFLQKFYSEEQKDMQQALNLGVLNLLLLTEKDKVPREKIVGEIRRRLHYYLYEFREFRPTNLIDIILDDSFKWYGVKPIKYDACKLLLAQIASYETIGSQPLYLCAIKKLCSITVDPKIITSALLHLPERLYVSFKKDFEELLGKVKAEEKYADRMLHLAFLHYANFYGRFEVLRTNFSEETTNERALNNQEWKILEKIHIQDHVQNVLDLVKATKYFTEFTKMTPPKAIKEIHLVLRIMKRMAFDAKQYGLTKEAVTMYDLIYQISTEIKHTEYIVTSLSNILYDWKKYETIESRDRIVNQMVEANATLIAAEMKNFTGSTEKQQKLVVTYLLNYALFAAAKGSLSQSCLYLKSVLVLLRKLESLRSLEVVYLVVEYLIATKYSEKCHLPHARHVYQIINYIKSGKLTKEIAYTLPLEMVRELVDYGVARFDTAGINIYVHMILKYILKTGMILKVADILLIAAKIDLAEEKVENCKSKLYYFMKIFHLDKLPNGSWIDSWQKNGAVAGINAIVQTPWEAVESAREMFLNHPQKCECLLCLQSNLREVSHQMHLFFVWILFNEKQYDGSISICRDAHQIDGIPQPYDVKSRGLLISALMQQGKLQESIEECEKTLEMCELLQNQRDTFRQSVRIHQYELQYELKRQENIPLGDEDAAAAARKPEKSSKARRYRRIIAAPVTEFESRLEEISGESPEGSDRTPVEGAKVSEKVNETSAVASRIPTRKGRQVVKGDEKKAVGKTKKDPPKAEKKKTTRSTKRI